LAVATAALALLGGSALALATRSHATLTFAISSLAIFLQSLGVALLSAQQMGRAAYRDYGNFVESAIKYTFDEGGLLVTTAQSSTRLSYSDITSAKKGRSALLLRRAGGIASSRARDIVLRKAFKADDWERIWPLLASNSVRVQRPRTWVMPRALPWLSLVAGSVMLFICLR
jgi:hypothetical protein